MTHRFVGLARVADKYLIAIAGGTSPSLRSIIFSASPLRTITFTSPSALRSWVSAIVFLNDHMLNARAFGQVRNFHSFRSVPYNDHFLVSDVHFVFSALAAADLDHSRKLVWN